MKKFFILAIGLAAGLTVYPQKHTAELFNVPGALLRYTVEGKGTVTPGSESLLRNELSVSLICN